ncbi:tRNA pseudouridine55 synthase [Curtobacterium sp. PhB130]|uniref:tRNA pseudouridine(55) synthase TruB n=1 Tax=unclassified Curtobacterium TaxID=257496 RepID=UPI000F4C7FF2|nr:MULTISPECIES: tRNA pseudouridine(55) synthase TruB [unclassified Curtobacterium]ROP66334.1 tRNA pseudouridine55 synthase [Curtobacterium sp. ZW137]ROS73209.1 tRNA pseudouridine55 synthase [Curtobacterium sp. PhB130]TCK61210.1 tRNA pseudouridine55 synthase [Curtobacterium sp. PhB136]
MLVTAPDGILLVDKPQGISSHRAVSIARRRLDLKKIGHAGTLDPMATGLLLLGAGPSTRLLTHLVGLDKTYTATIRLGVSTDSDDADGDPVAAVGVSGADVSEAAVEAAVAQQRGPISQVPSTVSAIKVDGRRAYDLARKGEEVTLKARAVTISRFEVTGRNEDVVSVDGVPTSVVDLDVVVACSSGTYVRALARDVGATLGTGAHLTALRRTLVGPFSVDDAIDLEDDAVDVRAALVRPAEIARQLFPVVTLDAARAKDLADGKRIDADHPDTDGPVAAVTARDDRLIGLVSVRRGLLRVITNFPTASGANA